MTHRALERKWPWHDFLTPQERREVRRLEIASDEAKRRLSDITAELTPIRKLAYGRAKAEARRAGQA
jgi:hypothetical protein